MGCVIKQSFITFQYKLSRLKKYELGALVWVPSRPEVALGGTVCGE